MCHQRRSSSVSLSMAGRRMANGQWGVMATRSVMRRDSYRITEQATSSAGSVPLFFAQRAVRS